MRSFPRDAYDYESLDDLPGGPGEYDSDYARLAHPRGTTIQDRNAAGILRLISAEDNAGRALMNLRNDPRGFDGDTSGYSLQATQEHRGFDPWEHNPHTPFGRIAPPDLSGLRERRNMYQDGYEADAADWYSGSDRQHNAYTDSEWETNAYRRSPHRQYPYATRFDNFDRWRDVTEQRWDNRHNDRYIRMHETNSEDSAFAEPRLRARRLPERPMYEGREVYSPGSTPS